MQINRKFKAVLVTTFAVGGVVTGATPSSAAALPGLATVDVNLAKPTHPVFSDCELTAAYTLDPRFINFVIHASATATGPSVGLATTVQCTVYDASDGRAYGGASGTFPGAHAEAIGQATVPVGRVPAVCVSGGAMYLDGTMVPPSPCP